MMLRSFLEETAREAGKSALGLFGKVDTEKKGTSIVSEADREAERLILSRIRAENPGEYVLAAESEQIPAVGALGPEFDAGPAPVCGRMRMAFWP